MVRSVRRLPAQLVAAAVGAVIAVFAARCPFVCVVVVVVFGSALSVALAGVVSHRSRGGSHSGDRAPLPFCMFAVSRVFFFLAL